MMNLPNDEVHLWLVHDQQVEDATLLQTYKSLLSPDEHRRHQRFIFPRHQHQFLLTRALVRTVLAQYLAALDTALNGQAESDPAKIKFVSNDYGKPALANRSKGPKLHFNLTHTQGLIVLAVSKIESMGVDVESCSRQVSVQDLAKRFFSPQECKELQSLSPQALRDRFFDLWTLKESYIKACGMGLSIPLDEFSFSFPNDNIAISFAPQLKDDRQDNPEKWHFWQLRMQNKENKIALAIKSEQPSLFKIYSRTGIPLQDFNEVEVPLLRKTEA